MADCATVSRSCKSCGVTYALDLFKRCVRCGGEVTMLVPRDELDTMRERAELAERLCLELMANIYPWYEENLPDGLLGQIDAMRKRLETTPPAQPPKASAR